MLEIDSSANWTACRVIRTIPQRMLVHRLIFGTLIAAGIIALVACDAMLASRGETAGGASAWWANGALSTLVVVTFALLAAFELMQMARHAGYRPLRAETYVFVTGLVAGPFIGANAPHSSMLHDPAAGTFWMAAMVVVAFIAQAVRRGTERALVNLSTSMFIVMYIALAGFLVKLRMQIGGMDGAVLLLFSVFLVKINDVGAFFAGRAFGRTKLIPWVSPKKTWEGMIGGVGVTILVAILGGMLINANAWAPRYEAACASIGLMALLGLMMAVFSVAGDLCESLLKRDLAAKDSSNLIPGLGGALDVLDSPLVAAPAAWFFWTRLAGGA